MSEIEKACAEAESAAVAIVKAAKDLERIATRLQRAAGEGNHAAIKAASAELVDAFTVLQAKSRDIETLWPFDDDRLTEYLESRYREDLIRCAGEAGVTVSELDDRLAAFPVVIQIQPGTRSLRIDRVRVLSLRPSRAVAEIKKRQASPGTRPHQFIETLFRAYVHSAGRSNSGATLDDLYEVLTLHPETRKSYSRAEFARDVFNLDSSGVRETRGGASAAFIGATGVKSGRGFVVIPPDGKPKHYYGVKFEEKK